MSNIIGTRDKDSWVAMRNLRESAEFSKKRNNITGYERMVGWYKEHLREYVNVKQVA